MKNLEELGISQAPWHLEKHSLTAYDRYGGKVAMVRTSSMDAKLISAAPKLYEALHGLLEIVCDYCKSKYNRTDGKCFECPRVALARAALAKAAGEGGEE